jgi:Transposase domain (DUF772)
MRGDDQQSGHLFSYLSPDERVPADHPLRPIRLMTDEALRRLSPRFDAIYAASGRPSVPPEQLLRALLLQVLYSVRSERLLMEQLQYNLWLSSRCFSKAACSAAKPPGAFSTRPRWRRQWSARPRHLSCRTWFGIAANTATFSPAVHVVETGWGIR